MDLEYLLLLQQFRDSAGSWFTTLMTFISDFASTGSGVLCVLVFWGVDRSLGYWLISNCMSGMFVNNFLKLTACTYRPWIRCPELKPPASALKSATGYSFPSGHTQLATAFYGSCALRPGKDHKKIIPFCIAMIFLTAFSRNFLGVHTPQDVLTAIAVSALVVFINSRLFDRIAGDPVLFRRTVIAGCALAVLCIAYFALKPYPMDYVDGNPVVDPTVMKDDGYAIAGGVIGFMTGAFLEIRYVNFTADGTISERIARIVIGLPFVALIMTVLRNAVYGWIGRPAGHVVIYGLLSLYIIFLYPAFFTEVRRRRTKTASYEKEAE